MTTLEGISAQAPGAVGTAMPELRWLRRLRLVGVVLPVSAIIGLQLAWPVIARTIGGSRAHLVTGAFSALAALAFGILMFALIDRGTGLIARQNRELTRVNGLLTEIARHSPSSSVLERAQTVVREELGAGDGGVVVPGSGQRVPDVPVLAAPVGGPPGTVPGWLWARRDHPATADEKRLLRSVADLVSLSLAQQEALEQERHRARAEELDRVARELHDSLAQVLGTLHLRLRALPSRGPLTPAARTEVDALGDLCQGAYQDVREAIVGLRSATATGEGGTFLTAVEQYVQHYERHGGPPTRVEGEDHDLRLPEEVHLHLLRVVQEALTNVRKHALAQSALVRVRREGTLEVEITDDGQGFDPDARCTTDPGGFGLMTMRERTELIGGELDVRSSPGGGTTVRVRLPLPGPSRPAGPRHVAADPPEEP